MSFLSSIFFTKWWLFCGRLLDWDTLLYDKVKYLGQKTCAKTRGQRNCGDMKLSIRPIWCAVDRSISVDRALELLFCMYILCKRQGFCVCVSVILCICFENSTKFILRADDAYQRWWSTSTVAVHCGLSFMRRWCYCKITVNILPLKEMSLTQPSTLRGTAKWVPAKVGGALGLESKGRYVSCHLWMNARVAGKTVWSPVNTCHTWAQLEVKVKK